MGATAGVMSVLGKVYAGQQQKASLDSTANVLNMEAGQAVASGIQSSIAARRRTAYVAGNANAAIAAGGLTTTGTSAQAVVGQIRGQGEYNARTAMYDSEEKANELNFDAAVRRQEGSAAATAGYFGASASIVNDPAVQDFYSKYGSAA